MKRVSRFILALSLLAGLADAVTGICLMLAPVLTLSMVGVEANQACLVLIRYIGAFVFAVGGSYLAGIAPVWRRGDWHPLRTVWWVTAWIRLVVCLFTSVSILIGDLELAWISVPLTDGFLALLQAGWLRLGPWPGGSLNRVS